MAPEAASTKAIVAESKPPVRKCPWPEPMRPSMLMRPREALCKTVSYFFAYEVASNTNKFGMEPVPGSASPSRATATRLLVSSYARRRGYGMFSIRCKSARSSTVRPAPAGKPMMATEFPSLSPTHTSELAVTAMPSAHSRSGMLRVAPVARSTTPRLPPGSTPAVAFTGRNDDALQKFHVSLSLYISSPHTHSLTHSERVSE